MTVYELTGAAAQLYEMLENEEIDIETVKDTLAAMGADEKIDNCCKVIKQLEADAESIKAEKMRLAKRQSSVENNAKRLRQSLIDFMNVTNQKSAKTLLFSVSKRATQYAAIDEGVEVPKEYLKIKTEVDATALKNALLAGEVIDGVHLAEKDSLTIR